MQFQVGPGHGGAHEQGDHPDGEKGKDKPPMADLQGVERRAQGAGADGFGQKRGARRKRAGREGQQGGKGRIVCARCEHGTALPCL